MKKLMITLFMALPMITFANSFDCTGAGYSINGDTDPAEMKVNGNVFKDTHVVNVRVATTFDTIITGNSTNPAATLKLIIKEGSTLSSLTVYSSIGIKEFPGLTCTVE